MKIALAQLNPIVGAVGKNADMLRDARMQAAAARADILVAGELFLSGYPPEDLVMKRAFLRHVRVHTDRLIKETLKPGPALIFGAPLYENGTLYNSVIAAEDGQAQIRHKVHLPNYGVFDELRLFAKGDIPQPVVLCGLSIGLPICEDLWFDAVTRYLKAQGADMLIAVNASPFERDKFSRRLDHAHARVDESGLPLIYVNQLGGQDELVFDGASFVLNADGTKPVQLPAWQERIFISDWEKQADAWHCRTHSADYVPDILADTYAAMVLGLRDYVHKNGFSDVVLGLSGGIDSALCAAIAVDALGAEHVYALMLPSIYTARESLDDAAACAHALGVKLDDIPITPIVTAMEAALAPLFAGRDADITEENLQSRIRGTLLMAISNKLGHMLVTTGNKSEVSVGYATLYGDMNGGYNPIKDIYKTDVFALANWRNTHILPIGKGPHGVVIPQNIITKPPSAELRPDQRDEDSLPPYDILDDILQGLVESEAGFDALIARGHAPDTIRKVEHLLYISEYKRRQAAPGVKIGARNFGRDRRYPITNAFRNAHIKDD